MDKVIDFVVVFDDGVRKRHYHETKKRQGYFFHCTIRDKDQKMSNYTNFLAMVSTEFHRYLMEHEKFASNIPANALVIFQVEGENNFNNWHKETSLTNREIDQPIIYVHVKKWRKHSSIEEIDLTSVVA